MALKDALDSVTGLSNGAKLRALLGVIEAKKKETFFPKEMGNHLVPVDRVWTADGREERKQSVPEELSKFYEEMDELDKLRETALALIEELGEENASKYLKNKMLEDLSVLIDLTEYNADKARHFKEQSQFYERQQNVYEENWEKQRDALSTWDMLELLSKEDMGVFSKDES